MLRPHFEDIKPHPLSISEESNPQYFVRDFPLRDRLDSPNLYMPFDMWRESFPGTPYEFRDRYYELPTRSQIKTLIIILKALHGYTDGGLDKRLIVPSNCIHNHEPIFPGIPWERIRGCAVGEMNFPTRKGKHDWVTPLFHNHPTSFETDDFQYEDEGTIASQIDYARWRSEVDDGQLLELYDDTYDYQGRQFYQYRRTLSEYGYCAMSAEEANFATRLYAVAHNVSKFKDIFEKITTDLV
jgi:hypothetical protein